jgi:hypothetical protein
MLESMASLYVGTCLCHIIQLKSAFDSIFDYALPPTLLEPTRAILISQDMNSGHGRVLASSFHGRGLIALYPAIFSTDPGYKQGSLLTISPPREGDHLGNFEGAIAQIITHERTDMFLMTEDFRVRVERMCTTGC